MILILKKDNDYFISVIVPIHIKNDKIDEVRKSIFYATTPIEVIYVVEKNLSDIFIKTDSFEKIVKIENKGRGFIFIEGIRNSKGKIILFLHSDTILPDSWDKSIRKSFENEKVVGGGFKLKFDVNNAYLNFAIKLLTFRATPLKILSGDRGLFVRSSLIKDNISLLEVPIMEDMELSNLMRKNGNITILNENIITSADAFIKNGVLRQAKKILICFLWYRIGGNLQKIYNYYYSKS